MKKDGLDIGDRMKNYEKCSELHLPKRIPVIIRVDGRAFHSVTKKYFGKEWSFEFTRIMTEVALGIQKEIQGCKFAYGQSDEISFLLTDYFTTKTEPWFSYDLRKLVSVSASLASSMFTEELSKHYFYNSFISFDSRAFSIPQDDVCNYFIWRQIDATRNAILFAGHENFSQKQLHGKSCNEIQEMLFQEKDINFNYFQTIRKRGFCIIDGEVDMNIPIFTKDREYIEKWVYVRED